MESEPVGVVARELGTNISRNKILQVMNPLGNGVSSTAAAVNSVASDRLAIRRVCSSSHTSKDTDMSGCCFSSLASPSLPSLLSPNELVYVGKKQYDKYFTFCLVRT